MVEPTLLHFGPRPERWRLDLAIGGIGNISILDDAVFYTGENPSAAHAAWRTIENAELSTATTADEIRIRYFGV